MPVSASFQRELTEVDQLLEWAQDKLHRLGYQANFERYPEAVEVRLQRRHSVIVRAREDLRDIPAMVKEDEERKRQEQQRPAATPGVERR